MSNNKYVCSVCGDHLVFEESGVAIVQVLVDPKTGGVVERNWTFDDVIDRKVYCSNHPEHEIADDLFDEIEECSLDWEPSS